MNKVGVLATYVHSCIYYHVFMRHWFGCSSLVMPCCMYMYGCVAIGRSEMGSEYQCVLSVF